MVPWLQVKKKFWRRFLQLSEDEFESSKIFDNSKLKSALKDVRLGKTVVSTNGCFDILHPGHIKFLESAKALGDILVVALNSDASVVAIKGSDRPVIGEKFRAYALSALSCTDYITIFDEPTPENILRIIRPDIHVKGEDYKKSDILEREVVEYYGGKITYLPLIKGLSTTYIIKKIKKIQ